jgi:CubicO group peptidase (beta-lactamase class C family)
MLSSLSKSLGTAVVIAAMSAGSASAQGAPLSAAESDPNVMGWMQGTPPPSDRLITAASPDFFAFPKLRWTVCNIRNLFGTVPTSRGQETPVPLDYVAMAEFADMRQEIDALSFLPIGGDTPMTFEESLGVNYTDGMLIIHEGEVVYERYSGCLTEDGRHAAMSMTKSTVGLLAEILIAEDRLDENAPVTNYVPELAGSGFETATVRQVMDMTTGIAFDENYDNPNADIWVYSASGSSAAGAPGYEGPIGYMQYLPLVERVMEHGAEFGYKTVNTDVLAWVVARVTGMSFNDALSEMLWSRMGAEQNAYFSSDVTGTPFAGGGMSASLRDMGRIGLLLLNEGVINGERVFPASAAQSIARGGDPAKFEPAGYTTIPRGSYRSMLWVFHNENEAYAARGVHGQTVYVDPTADMVLVRFSSFPQPKNGVIDPTSLPAYQAVADYLMAR